MYVKFIFNQYVKYVLRYRLQYDKQQIIFNKNDFSLDDEDNLFAN